MQKKIYFVYQLTLSLILFSVINCSAPVRQEVDEAYINSIARWDSIRLQSLKSADGWLNLAGLYWLQEGENRLGSGPENLIIFPRGPENIGTILFENGKIVFIAEKEISVTVNGNLLKKAELLSDKEGKPTRIEFDSLNFYVIKRGQRTGLRLRDYRHPKIKALQSIDRFFPDKNWIIEARFIENTEGITISVPDVLGDITTETIPGILEFEFEEKTCRLYPTGSRERMFLVFGDDTNALETYGAGRFLSIEKPDSLDIVRIDFNKAYNPPCAFSEFATCPLPPKVNMLPFKVLAGEKSIPH